MYSPKIDEDLIPELFREAKAKGIPMTKLVNQILKEKIQCREEEVIPDTINNKNELKPINDEKVLKQIISQLDSILNNINSDTKRYAEVLAERFRFCHRTIQQSIIRLIACFLQKVSEFDTDLRNKDSIEWCRKVSELDNSFPFF